MIYKYFRISSLLLVLNLYVWASVPFDLTITPSLSSSDRMYETISPEVPAPMTLIGGLTFLVSWKNQNSLPPGVNYTLRIELSGANFDRCFESRVLRVFDIPLVNGTNVTSPAAFTIWKDFTIPQPVCDSLGFDPDLYSYTLTAKVVHKDAYTNDVALNAKFIIRDLGVYQNIFSSASTGEPARAVGAKTNGDYSNVRFCFLGQEVLNARPERPEIVLQNFKEDFHDLLGYSFDYGAIEEQAYDIRVIPRAGFETRQRIWAVHYVKGPDVLTVKTVEKDWNGAGSIPDELNLTLPLIPTTWRENWETLPLSPSNDICYAKITCIDYDKFGIPTQTGDISGKLKNGKFYLSPDPLSIGIDELYVKTEWTNNSYLRSSNPGDFSTPLVSSTINNNIFLLNKCYVNDSSIHPGEKITRIQYDITLENNWRFPGRIDTQTASQTYSLGLNEDDIYDPNWTEIIDDFYAYDLDTGYGLPFLVSYRRETIFGWSKWSGSSNISMTGGIALDPYNITNIQGNWSQYTHISPPRIVGGEISMLYDYVSNIQLQHHRVGTEFGNLVYSNLDDELIFSSFWLVKGQGDSLTWIPVVPDGQFHSSTIMDGTYSLDEVLESEQNFGTIGATCIIPTTVIPQGEDILNGWTLEAKVVAVNSLIAGSDAENFLLNYTTTLETPNTIRIRSGEPSNPIADSYFDSINPFGSFEVDDTTGLLNQSWVGSFDSAFQPDSVRWLWVSDGKYWDWNSSVWKNDNMSPSPTPEEIRNLLDPTVANSNVEQANRFHVSYSSETFTINPLDPLPVANFFAGEDSKNIEIYMALEHAGELFIVRGNPQNFIDFNNDLSLTHTSPQLDNFYFEDNQAKSVLLGFNGGVVFPKPAFKIVYTSDIMANETYFRLTKDSNELLPCEGLVETPPSAWFAYSEETTSPVVTVTPTDAFYSLFTGTGQYELELFVGGNPCGPPTSQRLIFQVTESAFGVRFHYRDTIGSSDMSIAYSEMGDATESRVTFSKKNANGTLAGNFTFYPHSIQNAYYGPYGELIKEQNVTVTDKFRYTGHEFDQETGLNYMKGRYQFPMYAKFNRPDPMRDWDWLRPHTLNLYQYVGNDPINKWDPMGFNGRAGLESRLKAAQRFRDNSGGNDGALNNVYADAILESLVGLANGFANFGIGALMNLYEQSQQYSNSYYQYAGPIGFTLFTTAEMVKNFDSLTSSAIEEGTTVHNFYFTEGLGDRLSTTLDDMSNSEWGDFVSKVAIESFALLSFRAKASSKSLINHKYKYDERVLARGLENPTNHNFPYSFDDWILGTNPIQKKNGYRIYQMPGTMTGSAKINLETGIRTQTYQTGVFEIGVTKDGIIDHRFFRPGG